MNQCLFLGLILVSVMAVTISYVKADSSLAMPTFSELLGHMNRDYDGIEISEMQNAFDVADNLINRINSDPTMTFKAVHNINSIFSIKYLLTNRTGLNSTAKYPIPKNFGAVTTLKPPGTTTKNPTTTPKKTTTKKNNVFPVQLDLSLLNPCVGPVKDQKQCASSWAFATNAAIEYSMCVSSNNIYVSLSEQKLIDCDSLDFGCNGGNPRQAMDYYMNQQTMMSQIAGPTPTFRYRYTGLSGQTCNKFAHVFGLVLGCFALSPLNIQSTQLTMMANGPIIAGMAVVSSFFNYGSGVYNDPACDGQPLNHAVVIIGWGYDSASNSNYWIIRNSWGMRWGKGGYAWIQMGVNKCGIETYLYAAIAGI